jgi:general secretion pathway protein F
MRYRYSAYSPGSQSVSGEIEASTEGDALRKLKADGLTVTVLSAATERAAKARFNAESFLRQLGLMLAAGVSIGEAFALIREQSGDERVRSAESQLRAGVALSTALQSSGMSFPQYVPALVAASEARGELSAGLMEAADLMRRAREFRTELVTQMIYPTVLVVSGFAAVVLLFRFVVPKFIGMLKSPKADLPLVSKLVLQTGAFIDANFWFILAGAAAVAFLVGYMLVDPDRRVAALNATARVDAIAKWLKRIEIARWLRLMANLTAGRLRLAQCLDAAIGALSLNGVKRELERVRRQIAAGEALSTAIAPTGLLSADHIAMLRAGERAGQLALVFGQLADLEERAVRERVRRFVALLEPVAILVIGALIGTLMVGIMLAVTSLSSVAV